MKSLTFILILFITSLSINAQEFKFEKEAINYGKVEKKSNGERVFTFTNIGNMPLIISRVQSTCGCTIPKKPEKPIMPGEKGEIKVSYDTNKPGRFNKQIIIFSNAKQKRKIVRIKSFVNNGIYLEKKKSILSNI